MKSILLAIFAMSLFACGSSAEGSATASSSTAAATNINYPASMEKLHWLPVGPFACGLVACRTGCLQLFACRTGCVCLDCL